MHRTIKSIIQRNHRDVSAEEALWNIRQRKIAEQLNAERQAKFPILNADNLDEAIAWGERRRKEIEEGN